MTITRIYHAARRYTAKIARPSEVAAHFVGGGTIERADADAEAADAQERA